MQLNAVIIFEFSQKIYHQMPVQKRQARTILHEQFSACPEEGLADPLARRRNRKLSDNLDYSPLTKHSPPRCPG